MQVGVALGGDLFDLLSQSEQIIAPDPYRDFGSTSRDIAVCDHSDSTKGARVVTEGVGVALVHAVRGTGRSFLDAELLAIDEINADGGVMGRQLLPMVINCPPNEPDACVQRLTMLATAGNVSVVFGSQQATVMSVNCHFVPKRVWACFQCVSRYLHALE